MKPYQVVQHLEMFWQFSHKYTDNHKTFKVEIANKRCFGYFSFSESYCRFDFQYDPLKGGTFGILGQEDTWEIPPLQHPNDLCRWLKEFFR